MQRLNLSKNQIVLFCCLLISTVAMSQRHRIELGQADPRFYIWAESGRLSFGSEYIHYFVQNKTNHTYRLVVDVTLRQFCEPSKTYKLGYNQVVFLKPGDTFSPKDDNYHILNHRDKEGNCTKNIPGGKSMVQSISYTYSSIENVTLKEEEERKAAELKKQQAEAEKKRIADEKAAAKKLAEEKEAKRQADIQKKKEQDEIDRKKREADQVAAKAKAAASAGASASAAGSGAGGSNGGSVGAPSPEAIRQQNIDRIQEQIRQHQMMQQQKQQQIEAQRAQAKAEADERARENYRKFQEKMAENQRKTKALEDATGETMKQWAQGNYIDGSKSMVNELASQGHTDAAIATAAVGVGMGVFAAIQEQKRKKEEREARIAEENRIAEEQARQKREMERERQRLLQEQKDAFNEMANQEKLAKRKIIDARKAVVSGGISHTPTGDVYADNNEPLYIFYVQAASDYDHYRENISFPNLIEVSIAPKPVLEISPIIIVKPKPNGEYPFVGDIISQVEQSFITKSAGPYKIFDWSRDLAQIQEKYAQVANDALSANFEVKHPGELVVELHNEDESGIDAAAWGDETAPAAKATPVDYWGIDTKPKTPAAEVDYWGIDDKTEPAKPADAPAAEPKEVDYWAD